MIVRSKGLSRVSSSGIRTTADFSPPFCEISPASSAFPIPSLLGAGPTACKDESQVNWAQSDIEEEEELEEIALEPDFNYSTCNCWEENLRQTIQHTAASIPRRMPPPSGIWSPTIQLRSAWPPFLPAASRENLGHPFTPSTLGPVPGSHGVCTPCRFTERTPSFQILWLLQAKSLAWCTIQPATSAKAPLHAPSSVLPWESTTFMFREIVLEPTFLGGFKT